MLPESVCPVCPDCEAPREGRGRCACGSYAAPVKREPPSSDASGLTPADDSADDGRGLAA